VEHSCEKCGAAVEDGRPFCPQCRAPQIHVQITAGAGEIAAPANDAADAAVRHPETGDFGGSLPTHSGVFDQRAAMRSALKAGALGTFLGMIPVLGIVLTGSLSVYFYRRKTGYYPPTGIGVRLGAAAGLVLFALNSVLIIPIILLHAQKECIDSLVQVAQKFGIDTTSPQFQASVRDLFTPAGLAKSLVVALILTSVGGALCALVMRRGPRS
jgi:hypothetical protein